MKKSYKFLIVNFFYVISLFSNLNSIKASCKVAIFDCGQGNTIVARYSRESMIFDAGQTSYGRFVQHMEDADDESTLAVDYTFKNNDNSKPFMFSIQMSESVQKVNRANIDFCKARFKEKLEDFIYQDNSILKTIFISHPDKDYFNLINDFQLKSKALVLGGKFSDEKKSKLLGFSKIVIEDKEYGNSNAIARYENHSKFQKYCSFKEFSDEKVKHPEIKILSANTQGEKNKSNKSSMIVKIKQRHSILLPGDADKDTWEDAQKNNKVELESDILLISHHGASSHGNTSKEILELIKPKICLISAGFQHKHPKYEVIRTLHDYYKKTSYRVLPHVLTCYNEEKKSFNSIITNIPVFSTIDNGCLTIDLSLKNLKITVARDFIPEPHVLFFSESSEFYYSLMPVGDRTVRNESTLKKRHGNKPLKEDDHFGEGSHVYKMDESYYFKSGDAYLQMEFIEESADSVSESVSDEED